MIEPFARYGFNKSHAVAYALVAYKTAYLKAHYPVDFLAATLSAEIGSTDGIVKVIGDCVEMGIPVLPPDINESTPEVHRRRLRDPLRAGGRQGGGGSGGRSDPPGAPQRPLPILRGFCRPRSTPRLVNKRALDALVCAGAFDSLGKNRATLSAASERVLARAVRTREEAEIGQTNLFGGEPPGPEPQGEDFPELPEWSLEERLKGEKEVLGFYVTGHPLTPFRGGDRTLRGREDLGALLARADQTVRVGGVLVGLKKQKIKKGSNEGKTMLKAVLEDMTGSMPVAIFANLYEKVESWVQPDLPVLVTGIVRESGPACELTVQEITPLEGISERLARSLQIRVNLAFADERVLARLKDRLKSHPGTTPVSIRLFRPGEFEATLKAADSMRIALSPRLTSEIRALAGEDSVEYVFE